MRTITMSRSGRLTLPADVRKRLGLTEETEMEVDLDASGDQIVLRPAIVLRREDAWAYTPEHRALLEQAHGDSAEGRVLEFQTEEELVAALAEIQERIRRGELEGEALGPAIAEIAKISRQSQLAPDPPF